MNEHDVCQLQINALKDDMAEFKKDVRDHLKEVKESNRIYAENSTILRENLIRLTTLSEKQDEQIQKQESRMERQEDMLIEIGKEVSALRKSDEINSTKVNYEDKKWYQKMIEGNNKYYLYLVLLIMAYVTGYKLDDIIKIFFPN